MLLAGGCPRRAALGQGVVQQSVLAGPWGAELQGAHVLPGGAHGAPLCRGRPASAGRAASRFSCRSRVRPGYPRVRECAVPGIGGGRGHAGPTGPLSSIQLTAGVSPGSRGLKDSPLPPPPCQGTCPVRDSGPSWCSPGHLLSALAPCGNQSSCLRPQRVWPRPLAPHSRRAAPLRAGVCLGNSQTLATGLPEPAELVGREPAGRCRACLCLGGEVPQL